ncbi:hypothetical protein OG858_47095 (plasmid) [Streptomyces europaeiscabiei]|uniref:hypothetical protein n=1 Tax=Streptomyces europaeiscabiei TaxID=146819 RepID=UPI002E80C841|nr:hypothetical protein [Streptomyces europaeiscabiei]WUD38875.1 hypothetical protein OG858_47095 [Streptomyces europaeiscabiei]
MRRHPGVRDHLRCCQRLPCTRCTRARFWFYGTKGDAITHALARPDARPDKVQRWADHRGSRTTQRSNQRKELLDDSPGYGLAADVAGALEHGGT